MDHLMDPAPRTFPSRDPESVRDALTYMMPPQPLTAGMPDPPTIAKQKDAYMKMLDEQVKQGTQVLEAQVKHQKEYLLGQADQQKKQFIMQIDMEVKQQEMALDQQKMEQLMQLQQQSAQQKAAPVQPQPRPVDEDMDIVVSSKRPQEKPRKSMSQVGAMLHGGGVLGEDGGEDQGDARSRKVQSRTGRGPERDQQGKDDFDDLDFDDGLGKKRRKAMCSTQSNHGARSRR